MEASLNANTYSGSAIIYQELCIKMSVGSGRLQSLPERTPAYTAAHSHTISDVKSSGMHLLCRFLRRWGTTSRLRT